MCNSSETEYLEFLRAVRTAKFVARKQWVVAGADDMFIRVYNHNTMEKIKSFEAHTDYIRWEQLPLQFAGTCSPSYVPPVSNAEPSLENCFVLNDIPGVLV